MKVIGTGSYGKVILSKKRDTGHIYAIKTLKKKHLIKKNQVEHTISERSILVSLGATKHTFYFHV
jgi:serum/glucocorticoid-regulated kinase 2